MHLLKYLKLAWDILTNSKLRSTLSIIGIIIGVASVIAILALGQGMQQQLGEALGGLGADEITIYPGYEQAESSKGHFRRGGDDEDSVSSIKVKNLTNRDVQALKTVPNVKYVSGVVSKRAEIDYLSESTSASVQGVDTQVWKYTVSSELAYGRFLSSSDNNAVVIGSGIAEGLFNQDIQLNRQIMIEGTPFRVVGIFEESAGFSATDKVIFMPIASAREVLEDMDSKKLDYISIKIDNPDLAEETVENIESKLMLVRAVTEKTRDFTVMSNKALLDEISSALAGVTLFLSAIAAISLLVGAVGIANTMFTTVLQKTKEIGIMKAVGAKNRTILLIFLLNSAMIGLVGGIMGSFIGVFISQIMNNMISGGGMSEGGRGMAKMMSSSIVSPEIILGVLGFSVLIGIISGVIPAYRASKMNPVDALRYE